MPSPHRWKVVSVVSLLAIVAIACSDGLTSPVVPAVEPVAAALPSLDVGGGMMTLVGMELLLENGQRIPVDSATAKNFRYLAASMPGTRELAKQLSPIWAKVGLPEPTSPAQARLAMATFKGFRSADVELRDVLMNAPLAPGTLPNAPVMKKPTLVADCDPAYTFCGFDTGQDPNGGGGSAGGSGSAGGGQTSPCISLFTDLYYATANWRNAVADLQYLRASLIECSLNHPFDWPVLCSFEAVRLTIGIATVAVYDAQMQSIAASLRANYCI